jgi:hypothetical protein
MDGVGHLRTNTIYRAECVGAWPDVGNLAQKLHGVPLLLQRIGGIGGADKIDSRNRHFKFLSFAGGLNQSPFHPDRRPGQQMFHYR